MTTQPTDENRSPEMLMRTKVLFNKNLKQSSGQSHAYSTSCIQREANKTVMNYREEYQTGGKAYFNEMVRYHQKTTRRETNKTKQKAK